MDSSSDAMPEPEELLDELLELELLDDELLEELELDDELLDELLEELELDDELLDELLDELELDELLLEELELDEELLEELLDEELELLDDELPMGVPPQAASVMLIRPALTSCAILVCKRDPKLPLIPLYLPLIK